MRSRAMKNVAKLAQFIDRYNGPFLQITIELGPRAGEDDDLIRPPDYEPFWTPWRRLRENVVQRHGDFEIVVETSPLYIPYWVHLLVGESLPSRRQMARVSFNANGVRSV